MATLKIEKIHTLATVDDDYRILHDVDVLIEGDKIHSIGANLPTPPGARVIDGVLKERGAARAEYDRALHEGRRAAIAE